MSVHVRSAFIYVAVVECGMVVGKPLHARAEVMSYAD